MDGDPPESSSDPGGDNRKVCVYVLYYNVQK